MYQSAPLPGAYYGPTIPPSRPKRRSRGCLCCLLSTAAKIIVATIVTLGIVVLVLWLIFRPNNLKAYVTTATLTQFNYTTTNNDIRYNLTTVVGIRNPNKRVGLYYDSLEADAFYQGKWFAGTSLPTFYQGHKNTTTLFPAFYGGSTFYLDGGEVSQFETARKEGSFDVELWLNARIRFKVWSIKTSRITMRIKCDIRSVPLVLDGSTRTGAYFGTPCDVHL